MRFARVVFGVAGVWGVLALTPLYFTLDLVGRMAPPPVTHPEFYYGFAGVALAWQVAFLVIAFDPGRFRLMIIPAILEKLSYVLAIAALYLQGRLNAAQSVSAVPDSLLGALFVIAYFKLSPNESRVDSGAARSSY